MSSALRRARTPRATSLAVGRIAASRAIEPLGSARQRGTAVPDSSASTFASSSSAPDSRAAIRARSARSAALMCSFGSIRLLEGLEVVELLGHEQAAAARRSRARPRLSGVAVRKTHRVRQLARGSRRAGWSACPRCACGAPRRRSRRRTAAGARSAARQVLLRAAAARCEAIIRTGCLRRSADSRRRTRGTPAPSRISKSNSNRSRSSRRHFDFSADGQTTRTRRSGARAFSSVRMIPASIVFPSPTSSAISMPRVRALDQLEDRLELVRQQLGPRREERVEVVRDRLRQLGERDEARNCSALASSQRRRQLDRILAAARPPCRRAARARDRSGSGRR